MTFQHEGITYKITFKHAGSGTVCGIWEVLAPKEYNYLTGASARKSKSDTLCRETGRTISLERALKEFSREFRTAAWKAYHDRKPEIPSLEKQLAAKDEYINYLEDVILELQLQMGGKEELEKVVQQQTV